MVVTYECITALWPIAITCANVTLCPFTILLCHKSNACTLRENLAILHALL